MILIYEFKLPQEFKLHLNASGIFPYQRFPKGSFFSKMLNISYVEVFRGSACIKQN